MTKRVFVLLVFAGLAVVPGVQAKGRELKGQTWVELPSTARCKAFKDFAVNRQVDPRYVASDHGKLAPFNTDQIMVIKDGKVAFEWHDGLYTPESPHILWSVSKMITATLLERAVQEGANFNGKPVTLQTRLSEFFPQSEVRPGDYSEEYEKVRLENLVEMDSNFAWKEYYDSDLSNSSFFSMPFEGFNNMAAASLRQPFNPEGPGGRWVYGGNNANIVMAMLERSMEKGISKCRARFSLID